LKCRGEGLNASERGRGREREKWLPKYGTKTATTIVERTRAVRIRIEHD